MLPQVTYMLDRGLLNKRDPSHASTLQDSPEGQGSGIIGSNIGAPEEGLPANHKPQQWQADQGRR